MYLQKEGKISFADYFLLFLCILPFIFGLLLIIDSSSNVPYRDQWNNDVRHLIMFFDGDYSLSTLLEVHNDHRPIIPRLIYYPIEIFSKGNFKILAYVGYLFHTLSFILIVSIVRKWIDNNRYFLILIIPLSLFWFNLYLTSAFLWGLSIDHSVCIFFAILTSIFISRSIGLDNYYFFSIITAMCCMFSFAAGLFVWISGLIVFFLERRKENLKKIIIWIVSALIFLAFNYLILGFQTSGRHGFSGYEMYINNFIIYLPYRICNIIGSLGSQIVNISFFGLLFGLILIIFLIIIFLLNKFENYTNSNSIVNFLLIFSFTVCAAIAITRSGQGTDFGPANIIFFNTAWRQYPVTFLLIPSIYLYIVHSFFSMRKKPDDIIKQQSFNSSDNINYLFQIFRIIALVSFAGLMIFSSSVNFIHGIYQTNTWKEDTNEKILVEYKFMNDTMLKHLHQSPDVIRFYAPDLEKYQLSVFNKK